MWMMTWKKLEKGSRYNTVARNTHAVHNYRGILHLSKQSLSFVYNTGPACHYCMDMSGGSLALFYCSGEAGVV